MKVAILLLILSAASFPGGISAGQRGTAPFSVAITAPQNKAKAGSEVKIEIDLKNTSATDLSVAKSNAVSQAEFHYLIDVRDGDGHEAPDTEYRRRIMGKETKKRTIIYGSDVFFTLKPNETLGDEAVVSKLYDLSRPGKYVIQVSRVVPEELGGGTVKSNICTITIY